MHRACLLPALFLLGCAAADAPAGDATQAVVEDRPDDKAEDALPPAPEVDGRWTATGPGGATHLHVRRVGERWFAGLEGGNHARTGPDTAATHCRVETALNWDGEALRGRNAAGVEVVITPDSVLTVAAKTGAHCGAGANFAGTYVQTGELAGDALPSFDCGRAADDWQMVRCRVPALAELDAQVALALEAHEAAVPADVAQAQTAFAVARDACFGGPEDPVPCLEQALAAHRDVLAPR